MAKGKKAGVPQPQKTKDVYPEASVKELVELMIRDKANKEDLAQTETRIIDKMHNELKPFHDLSGEFRALKRFFYIGVSAALLLLCKMAFAPKLFTLPG